MSENRIQYNEACPVCKAEGRENEKLFLDMDKVEIRCETGHVFEELPIDKALRNEQEILRTEQPQADKTTVSVYDGCLGGDVSSEIPAVIEALPEPVPTNTLEEPILAESGRERIAEIAANMPISGMEVSEVPTDSRGIPAVPVTIAGRKTFVCEDSGISLPNGDLLLCIRIPEQWRQAVESEAESQMKSPAKYFADWLCSQEMQSHIIDGLVAYWTASYAQAR